MVDRTLYTMYQLYIPMVGQETVYNVQVADNDGWVGNCVQRTGCI